MNPIKDYEKISEYEQETLKPGAYVCTIMNATDNSAGEYLRIDYDIADGEFKDYYKHIYLAKKATNPDGAKWSGFINKSYKEKALPFFKGFITAVEKSNPGFKWDWDETKLKGKTVVVNFREEEYVNRLGALAIIVRGAEFRSTEALKKGEIKPLPMKTLPPDQIPANNGLGPTAKDEVLPADDKLPF